MAKIHDRFIVELAEVIKGYGNDPDVNDPFRLSEFYRFYELPNVAVSRENFEKMKPYEDTADVAPVRHGRWVRLHGYVTPGGDPVWCCSGCGKGIHVWGVEGPSYGGDIADHQWVSCPNCGAKMDGSAIGDPMEDDLK